MSFSFILKLIFKAISIPPESGSLTSTFAAASTEIRKERDKYRGCYLIPYGKIGKCSKDADDPDLAQQLWETTEILIKELGIQIG